MSAMMRLGDSTYPLDPQTHRIRLPGGQRTSDPKPPKAAGELSNSEVDLQHPPMARLLRSL